MTPRQQRIRPKIPSNASARRFNDSPASGRSQPDTESEIRKLLRVDLLLIDDVALTALDQLDIADIYELIVERHRAGATVVKSIRTPIDGSPHGRPAAGPIRNRPAPVRHPRTHPRRRVLPSTPTTGTGDTLDEPRPNRDHHDAEADTRTRSHHTGAHPVPCHWRATYSTPPEQVGAKPPDLYRARSLSQR